MSAMIERFLRQKFESPLVVVTLAVLALLVATPPALSAGPARLVALLLIASGAVSRDASSGALQIILARPISRTEYLGGRLLGVMAAYAIFLAAATIFALLLSLKLGGMAMLSPALPRAFAGALLDGLQVAALLLLLSTLLPSYGDALGYLFLWIAFSTATAIGTGLGNAGMARAVRTVQENLLPEVRWDAVLAGHHVPAEALGRWALVVTVCFALAAVVVSRREFSYGQD